MQVLVNTVDVSTVWHLREQEGHLWCAVSDWTAETGVHLSEAPTLKALMMCTETECVPFPLTGPTPTARREDGQWWVRWDALVQALQGRWERDGATLRLALPPAPLHLPLALGALVPEMVFWQRDGGLRRLSDRAGKPLVLVFPRPRKWDKRHHRLIVVETTLAPSSTPDPAFSYPCASAWQIYRQADTLVLRGDSP